MRREVLRASLERAAVVPSSCSNAPPPCRLVLSATVAFFSLRRPRRSHPLHDRHLASLCYYRRWSPCYFCRSSVFCRDFVRKHRSLLLASPSPLPTFPNIVRWVLFVTITLARGVFFVVLPCPITIFLVMIALTLWVTVVVVLFLTVVVRSPFAVIALARRAIVIVFSFPIIIIALFAALRRRRHCVSAANKPRRIATRKRTPKEQRRSISKACYECKHGNNEQNMRKESDKTLTGSVKVTRLLPVIKSGSFASDSYRCGNAKQIVLQRPVDDCGSLPRAGLSGAPPRLLSPVLADKYWPV